ncbi:drug/metabolite transporter (DMT)-like permease [Anaerosolibacter carboniphilus]|uniref:Drug/metabolite transporter (DMT)-like permease n=1 Tax=Anaerosolibacter carboniphilus TaxID=1417629 RepID=A0A841KXN7_9FIRM|nr:DMT family transporter [Anaerosolibacter carboniphilus]MBB6218117.1 drug/metabolite transporter (DMT)-like permease [Anaerosolibacter carboniphilus]
MNSKKVTSLIGLFLVAIIWGSTFTFNKMALDGLTPISLMAARFMIAFIIMLIIFRKKFANISIENCTGGIFCGLALFFAFVLQTYGLMYTTASKQAFLSGAYVIAVPFLTWIAFKKRPSIKTYLGAAICFYGISLLSFNKDMSIGIGDTLTLISSVLFAAQIVIAGYYIEKEDAAVMATVQFGVMGVLSTVAVLIMKDVSFISLIADMTSPTSLSVIYLGIIGTAVAYYLQILCQRYTSPTATSIILSMEAVFGTLIAVAILGDVFTLKMIFGSIAILVSILINEL